MGTVIGYSNNAMTCYCNIRLESGECVMISMGNMPRPSAKVMKMMFGGMFPRATLWKLDSQIAGGTDAFIQRLIDMFTFEGEELRSPLDTIRDLLLPCSCVQGVLNELDKAERRAQTGAEIRKNGMTPIFEKNGRCKFSVKGVYTSDLIRSRVQKSSLEQKDSENSSLPPIAQMTLANLKKRLATTEEDAYLSLLVSAALAGLDERLSIQDVETIARWAGLPQGSWSADHEAAYVAALLHWMRQGSDWQRSGIPLDLAGLTLPDLPAPITDEIRSILIRVNIPPHLRD